MHVNNIETMPLAQLGQAELLTGSGTLEIFKKQEARLEKRSLNILQCEPHELYCHKLCIYYMHKKYKMKSQDIVIRYNSIKTSPVKEVLDSINYCSHRDRIRSIS